MKFSLNLASKLSSIYGTGLDPAGYDKDELVSRIGLQLGAVEDVVDYSVRYEGIVVVNIVSCNKHPGADKLSVCLVDDSGVTQNVERDAAGLVQVVCGAPNVRSGMLAAWIPPGATVPNTVDTKPFVLGSRELRGVISNGMLASPSELGFNDEHGGILEIDPSEIGAEVTPGLAVAPLYDADDFVIDCENKMFTHRPDCFGNIGIAREIAGIFGDKFKTPKWLQEPLQKDVEAALPIESKNDIQSVVPRFSLQVIAGVTVKDSPMWLQSYLRRVGIKSINNIVDYTNYFMMLSGQPLHAFDYDKLKALSKDTPIVFPRMAREGEKIALLNGKTITLCDKDIVIATDKQAIALGGVMGGTDTEIDENTKNIVIEGANFDMYAIRRSSMRHGLFTDAVTRFNKGQSPLQNDRVIAKMVDEVQKNAGGKIASDLLDYTGFDIDADNLSNVVVSVEFINSRLGTDLDVDTIKTLLENVEFSIEVAESELSITAPFWRMDIAIKEDIVEEVGRLHGYHNIPVVLPVRTSKPAAKNATRQFKQTLRDTLTKSGANELLTYSFVHGDLLRNTGTDPDKWAYHIRNALSPDLQYYRTSLVPSLLAKVHGNLKAGAGSDTNEFVVYEIGKVHVKGHKEEDEPDLPKQMRRLAFVVAADPKTAKKHQSSAYYMAKKYLEQIIGVAADYIPLDTNKYPLTAPYQIGRSAAVLAPDTEQPFAVVGEFIGRYKKALKLPEYCAGFEIDTDLLQAAWTPQKYQQMSQYPESTQDITYETPDKLAWAELSKMFSADLRAHAAGNNTHISILPLDIYKQGGSDKKRISFRVTAQHHDMTLRSEEVSRLLDLVTKSMQEKLHVTRI